MLALSATRDEGLSRLAAFLPRAGRAYAEGRNVDPGPGGPQAVSRLSPFIRHRLVTEREVLEAVLGRHGPKPSEKFVQEVLWRTYWKGWLEMRPSVWADFLAQRDEATEDIERLGLGASVENAMAGSTGIDGFDDWARELAATGYLHNHARMWFASIWIFTLRLPWTLGADFFLRHLLDADPASNTLSWRWVAGLQTPGKTYLATAENIARFTDGRFAPKGLALRADPIPGPPPPAPTPLRPAERLSEGPTLLLLTGEDMHPESLVPPDADIAGILVAARVTGGVAWPFGEKAEAFVTAGLADTAARAEQHFTCGASFAPGLDAASLVEAARRVGARSIATPYAPVGPVADTMEALRPLLAGAGQPLVTLRRVFDTRFWPHATKGFFPFREKLPALLAEEGLPA